MEEDILAAACSTACLAVADGVDKGGGHRRQRGRGGCATGGSAAGRRRSRST